ncbi:Methyltransferase domain-containing protein [Palleronia marisminoris]|uniref:Methyltransferase domain protein n=1 Tax=Palleronia marisminoris TaxID=315423 RepID=A0A1Y5SWX1_9RHOB|nr:methyltransferase domain-containing protein [Palleronia marisminoris]SFH05149.1 Methyltransferase domain-containing protein [Palleronia marisminoris]SLN50615.1 Methyltransferase domain protein [Palleronia marisminoris]
MTNAPPRLTDRATLARNRARTTPDALFLHEIAADQIDDRLQMVKRSFRDIAIVTGQPEFWAARFPAATVVADDETLDLPREAFDLVLHAMALHWANDPVGQLVQARHALRPDGLCLSVAFGGQTLAELRAVLAEAETRLMGGLSPRVAPMLEIRDAGSLLQRAGLNLPVADTEKLTVSYADMLGLLRELRQMGEANALAARDRRIPPRTLFAEAARLYHDRFPDADDPARIHATFELVHLSGWAPDGSQPKPLRPGSATTRLADALGTGNRDDSQRDRD